MTYDTVRDLTAKEVLCGLCRFKLDGHIYKICGLSRTIAMRVTCVGTMIVTLKKMLCPEHVSWPGTGTIWEWTWNKKLVAQGNVIALKLCDLCFFSPWSGRQRHQHRRGVLSITTLQNVLKGVIDLPNASGTTLYRSVFTAESESYSRLRNEQTIWSFPAHSSTI